LSYNIKTTRALTTPISKTPPKFFLAMAAPDLVEPAEPPVPVLVLVAAGLPPCVPAGLVAVAVPVVVVVPVVVPVVVAVVVAVPVGTEAKVLLGKRLIDVTSVPAHAWLKSSTTDWKSPWGSYPSILTKQSRQASMSSPLVFVHRQAVSVHELYKSTTGVQLD